LGARVDHVVSATLKTGDKLRNALDPGGWHMGHHGHKWQGGCGSEKAARPYGVSAAASFPADHLAAQVLEVYQRVEKHFHVLSAAVPHAEGNISRGSALLYCEVLLALREQEPALAHAPRILELGFNAGHMSAMLAECFPDADITSVDLHWHDYVPGSFARVKAMSSSARTLVKGDSREEVPKLQGMFDLIIVDGGHLDDVPFADLRNCKRLAHAGSIVMIDDICDYYAHLPPTAAGKDAVTRRDVVELGRRMTRGGELGFAFGKYCW
jgi:protein-L-isoaspartate O-methyltransferase